MVTFFVFDRPAPDGRWQVRRHEGGRQTAQEWHADEASAIAAAAELNDRAMRGLPLPEPARGGLATGAQIAAVVAGLNATPIVDRNGRRYAVHHRNGHSD